MKKMSMAWRLGLASLAWAGCFCLQARGETDGVWTYEVGEGGTATLTAYAGDAASVTIPASVGDGVEVAALGAGLFSGHAELKELRLEAALTSVEYGAFEGCTGVIRAVVDGSVAAVPSGYLMSVASLTELELGEGVESIGAAAFEMTGITNLVLPESMKTLGASAFRGCSALSEIHLNDGLERLEYNFSSCTALESVEIPDSVTYLGAGSFSGCTNLKRLVIGGGITNVGSGLFYGLTKLEELVLREGVEVIYQGTFNGGAGITELRLPNSLQRIEGGAFARLPNLTNIVWGTGIHTISGGVLGDCTALTELTIPETVTNLSGSAFRGCTGLTDLTIPPSVVNLDGAFRDCTGLTNVAVNATVDVISGAFSGCTGLESVEFGANVGGLDDGAFSNCTALASVEIPGSVKTLGEGVFDECTGLKTIQLNEGIESIGFAFRWCTALESVEIPDSVTTLSSGAFSGCTGITNLVIGDGITDLCGKLNNIGTSLERLVIGGGVKEIGCGMFYGLTNLTELVLSEGLEVIYQGTFNGGAGITELRLPDSLQRIEGGALNGLANLTNIVWGAGIREITQGVFGDCSALTELTIPASVTNLSGGVFANCTGLTNVTLEITQDVLSPVLFYGCTNLARVEIGDGVGALGEDVFAGCENLTEVAVPESWYGTDKLEGAGVGEGCVVLYGDMLAIRTTALPTAVAEIAYETTLEATGGTGPYTWSAPEGWYEETSATSTFAATGTGQGWRADEYTWDLELPFEFPFFGKTYTQTKISSNGGISFGTNNFPYSLYSGTPVIAALKADFDTRSGDIYVDSGTDWVTVRWQGTYYGTDAAANFSTTLHADGTIELKYGEGNEYGGTIGISAGDREMAQFSTKDSSGSMANAADVVFTPRSATPLPGWLELTEDGVLRGMTENVGSYSFTVMATDAEGVTVPRDLTLEVSDERWIVQCIVPFGGSVEPMRVVVTNGMTVTLTAYGDGREFIGWSWESSLPDAACPGATWDYSSATPTWTWTVPEGSGWVEMTVPFQPREFYVNAATGNDRNAGTEEAPLASLQAAIDRAADGETVWVAPGTYAPIHTDNRKVRIVATQGPEQTAIDASGTTNRCALLVDYNSAWSGSGGIPLQTNSVLEGFTLRGADIGNDNTGGGALGGTLVECNVTGNRAGVGGGLTFGVAERCNILDNTATQVGGGMNGGIARECRFEGNRVIEGNGGGAYSIAAAIGCEFIGNEAFGYGGGGVGGSGEITDCLVCSNRAPYSGGGLYSCTTVTGTEIRDNLVLKEGSYVSGAGMAYCTLASNCVIRGNRAYGYEAQGGGAYKGELVDCVISGNRAEGSEQAAGGGVASCDLAWKCVISGNVAVAYGAWNGGNGGGASETALWECRVVDNLAQGGGYVYGGGAYSRYNKKSALECEFSGNRVETTWSGGHAEGGAAYGIAAYSCTVSNNEANAGGGLSGGTAQDTVITQNRATQRGGGTSGTTMTNCIVARNYAPVDGGCAGIGGWNNTVTLNESEWQETRLLWGQSNLLVWGETVGGRMQPVTTGMTANGTPIYEAKGSPMVDPWGGDYRLLAGSEAIDAGTSGWDGTLYYDMDGESRIRGSAPDLGALESNGGVEALAITVLTEGSGKTDILCENVAEGGSVTATATGGGRPFLGWKVDGEIVSTARTYTWENVTEHGILTAVYGPGDIWVDAENGDDGNDGSESAPLKTLQAAAGLACDGDTVRAKPGIYDEVMVGGKSIDIVGEEGAAATIIDGHWKWRCATLDNGVCLRGFTLRRGNAIDEGVGPKNGAACLGGRLEECIVEECIAGADGWGNSANYNILRATALERCVVRNCRLMGGTIYDYWDALKDCVTNRNTLVTGNQVWRLWNGPVANENLTLAGNEVSSTAVDGGTWRNCIVWGNGETYSEGWKGGWICMEGAEARAGDGENGPVWTEDPQFAIPENGDWRLATTSPYLDAGNAGWTEDGATDLAGNARIDGAGLDLGCYEGGVEVCRVTFELGEGIVQLDARPLSTRMVKGTDAPAPEVAAVSGWRFEGWTPSLEGVTEDTAFVAESTAALSDWTAVIHRGPVETDTTWAAGTVHVVEGTVTVAPGMTLTIEAGAVVKFAPGARLVHEDGGMIVSAGATFTHLYDDDVGGDTLGDGAERVPVCEEYDVQVDFDGGGTKFRYLHSAEEATPDGDDTPSETVWEADEVHVLRTGYTVGFGKTLRLRAGTIVKIGDGQSLTVQGRLISEGTASRPVVITSMHDDEHGGDTNGDGDGTNPQPGDWKSISVPGTANFRHTKILYGASGLTRTDAAILVTGGDVDFNNSELAFGQMVGGAVLSGHFRMTNSIVREFFAAFGNWQNDSIVNGVIYNCNRLSILGGQKYFNCILAGMMEETGSANTYEHCLFWNEPGLGMQNLPASASAGAGNMWGDPKFVDPGNGDFHVQEGSACIDAGDGTVAPEMDMFGNPRVTLKEGEAAGVAGADGAVADIGVHEYSGRYSAGEDVDITVTEIRVMDGWSADVAPGDEVFLVWRLESVGAGAFSGVWTDRVKLSDGAGREAVLGEVSSAGRIEPETSKLYWGTFTVPNLMDGEWRLGVEANIDRGVLEGANTENNVFMTTNSLIVENPTAAADGGTVGLAAGETKLVRLTGELEAGDALRATAAGGVAVTAWAANGVVPAEGQHWACAATADGGVVVSVGTVYDAEQTYLLLKNEGDSATTVTLARGAGEAWMVATGLERSEVTAGPTVGVVLNGVGLAKTTKLELLDGETVVATGTRLQAGPGKVSAVFDLSRLARSGAFSVRATDREGIMATAPGMLRVSVLPTATSELKYGLTLPESVRDGRIYKGEVWYRNVGKADMNAPVFEVFTKSGNALVAMHPEGGFFTNGCLLTGFGKGTPSTILRAGEQGKATFYFRSLGGYRLAVRWVDEDSSAKTGAWLKMQADAAARREAEEAAHAEAVARGQALGASMIAEYAAAYALPETVAETGSLAGRLETAAGASVTGATVRLEAAGNVFWETTTDESGAFTFGSVYPMGTYAVTAEGWALAGAATLEVTGRVDGVTLEATRLTRVTGTLTAGGEGIDGIEVWAKLMTGADARDTTGEGGVFDLGWLEDGEWTIRSAGTAGFSGASATVAIAGDGALEVPLAMTAGVRWEGRVVDADGGAGVEGVEIGLCDAEGIVRQSTTSGEGGAFAFESVPEGAQRVCSLSEEWQVGEGIEEREAPEGDIAVSKAPLAETFPSSGFAPLAVRFGVIEAEATAGVTAWAWDFDGDGTVDSTEEEPIWTYTEAGTYAPSVALTMEDGSTVESGAGTVTVLEPLETVYLDDVVVLLDGDAAKSADWEFVDWDETTGILRVRQMAATPALALAAGIKAVFDSDGDTILKKATSAAEDPDEQGVWVLATEDVARPTEVYWQVSITASTVEGGGASPAARGAFRPRLGGSTSRTKEWEWTSDLGEHLTVEFHGDVDFFMNYFIRGGLESRDLTMNLSGYFEMRGDTHSATKITLEKLSKHFEWPLPIGNKGSYFAFDIQGGAAAMAGLDGNFSVRQSFSDRIHIDNSGAVTRSPLYQGSSTLGATAYFGGGADVAGTMIFHVNTGLLGPVEAGMYYNVGMNVFASTQNAEFSTRFSPEVGLVLSVPFGGFSSKFKKGARQIKNQIYNTVSVDFANQMGPARNYITETYGGPLGITAQTIKAIQNYKEMELSSEEAEGFKAVLTDKAEQLRAHELGLTSMLGVGTDMVWDRSTWNQMKMLGIVHGSLGGLDKDLAFQKMATTGLRSLTLGDTKREAAEKGLEICRQNQYVSEAVQRRLVGMIPQDMAGRGRRDGPNHSTTLIGDVSMHKAIIGGEGVEEIPNPLRRAVMEYGDGNRDTLQLGATTTLDHPYAEGGFYIAQIEIEHTHLSLPPQPMLIQAVDLDLANEQFPTATKVEVALLADELGLSGPRLKSKDAWNKYRDDKVPMGLKALTGLNPLHWNTSGDGIDDDWALKMGLDPALSNAGGDPDSDGLSTYQEYLGSNPAPEPSVQSRRRSLDYNDTPSEPGSDFTHPLNVDTDQGGICDGREILWGTDPHNGADDPACTGCADHPSSIYGCACHEKYELDWNEQCFCGGCAECLRDEEESMVPITSHDPNEIRGPLGAGDPETERYVLAGDELEYAIYFENKSDAEASAQEIRVEMQLDPGVDWSTFAAGSVQVGSTWDEGLAGKANWTSEVAMAEGTFKVRSQVTCDAETGKVEWYLRVVDPEGEFNEWPDDPYAGILPPNDPETRCGEGMLTFSVKVREDAEAGSVVAASATITFDLNEPIETDPSWWNTVSPVLYSVTFVNENGRVLKKAKKYPEGTAAVDIVQPEETPRKASDAQYTYAFAGWEPPLAEVTEDATYTAEYTPSLRSYVVRFEWHGGESEATYEYGTPASGVAVPDDPERYVENGVIYTFRGWNAEVAEVTGAATYRAEYDEAAVVAQVVGGDVYPSLAAAIAAAEAGATVVLLADDEVSFAEGGVVIDKDIVIDGGGFTVKGVSNANIHNVTAGAVAPDVEFDGVDGSNVRGFFVKGGDVTFTNLVFTEFGDTDYVNKFGYTPIQTANAYDGALTIADVDFDKFNRTAICIRGGTFAIRNCLFEANAENRDVLSEGKDHFQQPIEIRGGTGTIEGVSISGGDVYGSNGGGAIVVWSEATIRDATIDFTGVGIWADYAAVTVTGGDTSVIATDKALFVEDGGSITVEAGDFAGELAVDAVEGSRIVVTGGTFDAPVPAAFAGAGLAPTKIADAAGKYTVKTARTVAFDSNGGTAVEAVVVADGEPVEAPDPAPQKENFRLRAWQLDGADYDFATPVTADIELVADWTELWQTVTFDGNGGTPEMQEQVYETDGTYSPLPEAARLGYAFAGWWTAASGGTQVTVADAVTAATARTLYAHWKVLTYTVAFNANGGTGTMAKQTIRREVSTKLSANKFARSGYVFMGWAKTKTGAVAYANGASVKNLAASGKSVTLYARWAKKNYKVAFNANGGTLPRGKKMAAQTMTYGKAAKLRANVFTRSGYVFIGWAKTKTGAVAYANAATVKNLRTDGKTTTLYAKWAKKSYKIAYNGNGGKLPKGKTMAAQTVAYGKAVKLRANLFTRSGYVFTGWAKTKTGAVAYANGATVKNVRADGKTQTLYAKWTNKQKVAFNANGGTCGTASKTVTIGKTYGTLPSATRTDRGFTGWYTAKTGGTKVASTTKVTASAARTLYARWTTNQVVTFNANGGTCGTASRTYTIGQAYGSLPEASQEGSGFTGWFTAAEGGTQVTAEDLATTALKRTLYAQWTEPEPAPGTTGRIAGIAMSAKPGCAQPRGAAGRDGETCILLVETEPGTEYELQWTAELGGEWEPVLRWVAEESENEVELPIEVGERMGFFRLVWRDEED